MKIAVPFENDNIYPHFGHTAVFKIYEVQNGKISTVRIMPTLESGHGALAGFLAVNNVGTLICGGIGDGAKTALAEVGIKVFGGVSGNADTAVYAYLAGKLEYDPEARCDHHDHVHGEHKCGEHGCGGNCHSK